MPGPDGSDPAEDDTADRGRYVVPALLAAAVGALLGAAAVLFTISRAADTALALAVQEGGDAHRTFAVAAAPMITVFIAAGLYARLSPLSLFLFLIFGSMAGLLVLGGAVAYERTSLLRERGVARDGVVVEREVRESHGAWHVRRNHHCVVEYVDDGRVGHLSGGNVGWCVDARVGDRVVLTADPAGELAPVVGEPPGTLGYWVMVGVGGTVHVLFPALVAGAGHLSRRGPPAPDGSAP